MLTQTAGAYLQWKPVCYTDSGRTFKQMSKAKMYNLTVVNSLDGKVSKHSVAYAYFGDDLYEDKLSVTGTNVSYGVSKDRFYINTNYTLW